MPEIKAIEWEAGKLRLLDQTALPGETRFLELEAYLQVIDAIRGMKVRGAPAIGVAAAYAMAMAAREADSTDKAAFLEALREAGHRIGQARPTAVNITWGVERMLRLAKGISDVQMAPSLLLEEAHRIQREDEETNRRIGAEGKGLIPNGGSVLTHCNTGALATAGYGTALGVIRASWEEGNRFQVFATETRPFLQGARLTAWELVQLGIPATLVVDSSVGLLMRQGEVACAIVGADRIAANGDVANKIGTYQVAVLAKENNVPFYVAAPTSTIDLHLPSGDQIPIEERHPDEVANMGGVRTAAAGIGIRNPAFDVTPHEYVAGIITELGIIREPYVDSLANAVAQSQGGVHA
jgi:methylthioribose-1-phosphate isomerase